MNIVDHTDTRVSRARAREEKNTTFPSPNNTPEESDGSSTPEQNPPVSPVSEREISLFFTRFLTFWHLRKLTFQHFLLKVAHPWAHSGASWPTVKRGYSRFRPFIPGMLMGETSVPPGEVTPGLRRDWDRKSRKGSRNGAERQETSLLSTARTPVPGRLISPFLHKTVKSREVRTGGG